VEVAVFHRTSLLLTVSLAACGSPGGSPADDAPDAAAEAPDVAVPPPDDATATGVQAVDEPPRAGAPCPDPGDFACAAGGVLFCRDGLGGARWVSRGACPADQRCAAGYGCAPLPDCGTAGLVACAHRDVFACDESGGWSWQETCPEEAACIHGRGCVNETGVGESCNPDHGPRCRDGRIQHCDERGMGWAWAQPAECPAGSACVDGQGCVRPGDCADRNAATCLDPRTARYCDERPDGALGWSPPVACRDGCVEGSGCMVHCRDTRWIGGCLP
jgi:hypothetical protein